MSEAVQIIPQPAPEDAESTRLMRVEARRECVIVLPVGADGQSMLIHDWLGSMLASAFGGFTALTGVGVSTNPDGTALYEPVVSYHVGVPPVQEAYTYIQSAAIEAGVVARQRSMYVRTPAIDGVDAFLIPVPQDPTDPLVVSARESFAHFVKVRANLAAMQELPTEVLHRA